MISTNAEPLRILLIKPFQPTTALVHMPPLGILYLASTVRQQFGEHGVEVRVLDQRLNKGRYNELAPLLDEFRPHLVGISALNLEAEEAGRTAHFVKTHYPHIITALGGPLAHRNTLRLAATGVYDWIFDGEADLAFPCAIERQFRGNGQLDDVIGLTWRDADGNFHTNGCSARPGAKPMVGAVTNLDDLPFPAWDLVDFDAYAVRQNMATQLRGKRYAPIFTSRGCPYLCTYCHDIFGKKLRWRSPENVLAEMRLLREKYGVDELQIIDDIFNLNSGRMKEICTAMAPMKFKITFPNGLRADILDEDDVEHLVKAGMYYACVAIETVSPRLQDFIRKRLHLDRLEKSVQWMAERGCMIKGFFMLGFPTETLEEIEATISWAVNSHLTHAGFYQVVPQPGTPLYEQALSESKEALERMIMLDMYSPTCWYAEAYGVDLMKIRRQAVRRFFLTRPKRLYRIFRGTRWYNLWQGFSILFQTALRPSPNVRDADPLPEALQPLGSLYSTEVPVATPYRPSDVVRGQVGLPVVESAVSV
ncbi:MAG: B12-binding domain-containing radical SAM protein [Pirellulales bacterium]|nr:B12-binding domain-containing radical SAM protein [Pirellulales bacterium]